jgi:hypothetical protein
MPLQHSDQTEGKFNNDVTLSDPDICFAEKGVGNQVLFVFHVRK